MPAPEEPAGLSGAGRSVDQRDQVARGPGPGEAEGRKTRNQRPLQHLGHDFLPGGPSGRSPQGQYDLPLAVCQAKSHAAELGRSLGVARVPLSPPVSSPWAKGTLITSCRPRRLLRGSEPPRAGVAGPTHFWPKRRRRPPGAGVGAGNWPVLSFWGGEIAPYLCCLLLTFGFRHWMPGFRRPPSTFLRAR